MKRPELGQKVIVRTLVQKDRVRTSHYNRAGAVHSRSIFVHEDIDPRKGVYVGCRQYSIGEIGYWNDDEWIPSYVPTNYQEVWLVVFNEHENPVAVLPEHCEVA